MARIETWFNQDLQQAVKVHYLDGNVFSADNSGNVIGVNVFDGGSAATLSGSVSGNIIRADGVTVAVEGTLSVNRASIVLPQSAYAVPGAISIVIKLTSGTDITTLCAVVGNVYQSTTDSVVDPGTIIPSIETLIAEIEAAIASIPADYSALWTSLAPAFSSSGKYKIGQYVTYNGGVYVFTANHSGTWDENDVILTNIGDNITEAKKIADINGYSTLFVSNACAVPVLKKRSITPSADYMKEDGTMAGGSDYFHVSISVTAGKSYGIYCDCGLLIREYVLVSNGVVIDVKPQEAWGTDHYWDIYIAPANGTLTINSRFNTVAVANVSYKDIDTDIIGNIQTNYPHKHFKVLSNGTKTNGFYLLSDTNRGMKFTSDSDYGYFRIEIKPNTAYKLFGFHIQSIPAYIITDVDGIVTDYAKGFDVSSNTYKPFGGVVVTGETAKYMYVHSSTIAKKVYGHSDQASIKYSYGAIVAEEYTEDVPLVISNVMNASSDTYTKFNFQSVASDQYEVKIIPVSVGDKYFFKTANYYYLQGFAYITYDGESPENSGSYDSVPTSLQWSNQVVDVTKDGFIIVSSSDTMTKRFIGKVEDDSVFGKTWYVIGDSFTAFYANDANKFNYVDFVSGALGLVPTNVGVGGSGYKAPDPGDDNMTFVKKALGCAGYDLVTVYGSFNDIGASLPLGTVTDTGLNTLAGRMYNTIKNIRDTEPEATIVIIAPAPWISQNSVTGNAWGSIHPDDYVAMLQSICKRYNVCFVNPYSDGGAFPWDWATGESGYNPMYLYDGTHYNTYGHKKFIAPLVVDGILKAFRQFTE